MNLGKLKNKAVLDHYKEHGFSTRTEMIDEALSLFNQWLKRRERTIWRKKALSSYAEENPENYFEAIEDDEIE
jgi:hypothetical protein